MKRAVVLLALVAALAIPMGYSGCDSPDKESAPPAPSSTGGGGEDRVDAQYSCPMHPDQTSPKPGKCPICYMDLEKKGRP